MPNGITSAAQNRINVLHYIFFSEGRYLYSKQTTYLLYYYYITRAHNCILIPIILVILIVF